MLIQSVGDLDYGNSLSYVIQRFLNSAPTAPVPTTIVILMNDPTDVEVTIVWDQDIRLEQFTSSAWTMQLGGGFTFPGSFAVAIDGVVQNGNQLFFGMEITGPQTDPEGFYYDGSVKDVYGSVGGIPAVALDEWTPIDEI